jgi:hypothetical protein
MPLIPMQVYGAECDRCHATVGGHPDRAVYEEQLAQVGWRALSAGLYLCPACAAAVADPQEWAAVKIACRRRSFG